MGSRCTVALLVPDPDYCRSLKLVLDNAPGVRCVAVYDDLTRALLELPETPPDVLLVDLGLANGHVREFIHHLKKQLPQIALLAINSDTDEGSLVSAFRAGVAGYLIKGAPLAVIADAVKEAKAGHCPLSPQAARRLVEWVQTRTRTTLPDRQLSARERQVLSQFSRGIRNRDIAEALHLSQATVRAHLQNAYKKLHIHSRTQAAVWVRALSQKSLLSGQS